MFSTTLKEIVEQLEKCEYTTQDGHKLEMNTAFIALKKRAEAIDNDKVYIGQKLYADGVECFVSSISVNSSTDEQFVHASRLITFLPSAYNRGGDYVDKYDKLETYDELKKREMAEAKAIMEKYNEKI